MADTTTYRVPQARCGLRRSNIRRVRTTADMAPRLADIHRAATATMNATPAAATAEVLLAGVTVEAIPVAATVAVLMAADRIAPAAVDSTAVAEAVTAPAVAEATAAEDTAKSIPISLTTCAAFGRRFFGCTELWLSDRTIAHSMASTAQFQAACAGSWRRDEIAT